MSEPTPDVPPPQDPRPAVPPDALERGSAYQAAQRVSPWGYVFLAGLAALLTGLAWYRVEAETGTVTQVWIFIAAVLTLAPLAWHAVDFFQTVASRRGGAFFRVVATIALGLFVFGVVSALNVRFKERMPAEDMTETGRYTLGDETRKILGAIPKGGTVYATYLERRGPRSQTDDALRHMATEQLKAYSYAGGGTIVVRQFDEFRDTNEAKSYLQRVGVISTSAGEETDVIVLTYAEPGREVAQGKQKEVKVEEFSFTQTRTMDGQPRWLGERVITSAIQELVFVKLKAYATGGHGERSLADEMRDLRDRLRAQNVEVPDPPLTDLATRGVPPECDLLLVLDPKQPFLKEEEAALRTWLDRGGRSLFVTADVDQKGGRGGTGLRDLLKEYGLEHLPNFLVVAPSLVDAGALGTAVQMTSVLTVVQPHYANHPSVAALRRGSGFATTFVESSVVRTETEVPAGLTVDAVVWAPEIPMKDIPRPHAAQVVAERKDYRVPDASRDLVNQRLALVAVAAREIPGATPEAAKRESRIVLSGDTDVFSDAFVQQSAANIDLFGGLAQWALRREELAAVSDKTLDMEIASIADADHRMAFWWPLVTALCALLVGAGVWWARRR